MKIIFTILKALIVIVLLLAIIGFFLPSHIKMERSILIKGNTENAYSLVSDYHQWTKWCPWNRMDPNWKLTWGDTLIGLGSSYSWESTNDKVGNGRMRMIECIPNEKVRSEMHFMNEEKPAFSDMIFIPEDSGFTAHWSMEFDCGINPFSRWMGLIMDKMMGPYFDEGLALLKAETEKMPSSDPNKIAGFDFEWRQLDQMNIAGVREFVKFTDLNATKFGNWYQTIGKTIGSQKLQMAGHPMAIYYTFTPEGFDMEAAIPVNSLAKDDGTVKMHTIAASKSLVVKYYGAYEKTGPVYEAAYAYLKKNGMNTGDAPMEFFVTDPGIEKDSSKWLTEIVFPLK